MIVTSSDWLKGILLDVLSVTHIWFAAGNRGSLCRDSENASPPGLAY
jgi:hypothetical protein